MGVHQAKAGGKSSSGSENSTCKGTVAEKANTGGAKKGSLWPNSEQEHI